MLKKILITVLFTLWSIGARDITRTVAVTGYGEIKIKPDTVVIATGVDSGDPVIGLALESNSSTMDAIFQGLADIGVTRESIETSNYNVYLHRPYNSTEEEEEYRVSNSISIKIKNLDLVDVIIDLLISLGANKINGVYFTFEDHEGFTMELQKLAMKDAEAKAKHLAELSGMKLGRVVSISENAGDKAGNMAYIMATPMKSSNIESGMETIKLSYSVVYELETR